MRMTPHDPIGTRHGWLTLNNRHTGECLHMRRVRRDGDKITVAGSGEVDHWKTGQPVPPRPLGGALGPSAVLDDHDRRLQLAAWLVDPQNPLFARATVNRFWSYLFGRGLIEPVDDLRPTNPPTHPGLLDALAAEFISSGYNWRHLIRTLAASRSPEAPRRATS